MTARAPRERKPRLGVTETIEDDGAFHRVTYWRVVDTETGEVLLELEGRFTDSMFADQKEYDGVRFVELVGDDEHVLVHGYEGPARLVAVPRR